MKNLILGCLASVLALCGTAALALPGTFQIDQVYSDADGSVQFVVIRDDGQNDCDSGENKWAGQTLVSTGSEPQRTYVYPHDLSSCRTSGKRMLIATQSFAALGFVTPDYVIPDGFVQIPRGLVIFANITSVGYTSLPNDGIHAIDSRGNVVQNLATNFAGASASVVAGRRRRAGPRRDLRRLTGSASAVAGNERRPVAQCAKCAGGRVGVFPTRGSGFDAWSRATRCA